MTKYPIFHTQGNHQEIGFNLGKKLGKRLEENINYYIKKLDQIGGIDYSLLQQQALPWLRSLPPEYQGELENLALGADCSLQLVAKWLYSDLCLEGGCTSFIQETSSGIWVGRNNDYLIPGIWGYITIIEPENKIPLMLLGLEGGTFSGTGYNKERLWLHYNWLPGNFPGGIPPFVLHRMALETCSSVNEVEYLIKEYPQDSGMNLFVVDGSRGDYAVFECSGEKYEKRKPEAEKIVGANHFHFPGLAPYGISDNQGSRKREEMVCKLLTSLNEPQIPDDYISILGDPTVEVRGEDAGTVYSCVVCPREELIYYSANPYPAASQGSWEQIKWDW